MLRKVYVGNLPLSATEKEIRRMFARFGTVHSINIVTDRETGRSRGFGFVEMEQEDAFAATSALDGMFFGKRHLLVKPAKERLREVHGGKHRLTW
jgi:RNA recognition motif-containing protein